LSPSKKHNLEASATQRAAITGLNWRKIIASNDHWKDTQQSEIQLTGLAQEE
jgi:hypothetical protein